MERTMLVRRFAAGAALLAACAWPLPARAAPDAPDVVVLNDGTQLRGTISVEDPKEGVTIVLPGGAVKQIKARDVKRTVYGGGIAGASPPPPAPAPIVAQAAPPPDEA